MEPQKIRENIGINNLDTEQSISGIARLGRRIRRCFSNLVIKSDRGHFLQMSLPGGIVNPFIIPQGQFDISNENGDTAILVEFANSFDFALLTIGAFDDGRVVFKNHKAETIVIAPIQCCNLHRITPAATGEGRYYLLTREIAGFEIIGATATLDGHYAITQYTLKV